MIESVLGAVAKTAMPINKGVPGVPLHALDAISDENTRQVLRAIVDGWHVRNGSSGGGDNRFVTSQELDAIAGRVGGLAIQVQETKALASSFEPFGPGKINELISDLQAQVFESRLFKALEQRVDLIDKPGGIFERLGTAEVVLADETTQRIAGDTALSTSLSALGTRIGNAETALVTETTQRVNADNALQTSITTQFSAVNNSLSLVQGATTTNANNVSALTTTLNQVQASVGSLSSAIAAEATARADADGTLFAQYTLRVDVGGRVSGFGLASSQNVSDFIVRADRFSIVSPTGNKAALIMTNNTINVFDENGNLRVKIGKLA
jgi:hypothetical protein